MADRPRDDTWWLASDGKWYPADLDPDPSVVVEPVDAPVGGSVSSTGRPVSTEVPGFLTRFVSGLAIVTSAAFGAAAFYGLRYGSQLRGPGGPALDEASNSYLTWSTLALFGMVVTGIAMLVWTFRTSRAMDARGATGRRWRGLWTVGSWFIPLASFVLPKLVFNEIEKIVDVPYMGEPVGERWKENSRSTISDLWWLLWVLGLFAFQGSQTFITDPTVDEGALAVATSMSGVAHAILAGAGIAMAVVVRRIERVSNS